MPPAGRAETTLKETRTRNIENVREHVIGCVVAYVWASPCVRACVCVCVCVATLSVSYMHVSEKRNKGEDRRNR
eukprot:6190227-Pleurochrysis_carterae.AAC.1